MRLSAPVATPAAMLAATRRAASRPTAIAALASSSSSPISTAAATATATGVASRASSSAPLLLAPSRIASARRAPGDARQTPGRRSVSRKCGIIGIHKASGPASVELYEGLLMLQHRGQDSAGMVTVDGPKFHEYKANGLVSDVFRDQETVDALQGSVGLGHVRYPTAGSASAAEAQPFFVNSPLGIYLVHNGNLTNTEQLRQALEGSESFFSRHLRTQSDSEVLLNVLADEIHRAHQAFVRDHPGSDPNVHKLDFLLEAGASTMRALKGAYSCVALVKGVGLVAFRDPQGIRPLVLGARANADGSSDWCVASEDCAFGPLGFERVRDVRPGELLVVSSEDAVQQRTTSFETSTTSTSGSSSPPAAPSTPNASPSSSSSSSAAAAFSSAASTSSSGAAGSNGAAAKGGAKARKGGVLTSHQCVADAVCTPCVFEYIYLARPDSVLNDIPVYTFQLGLGTRLAAAVRRKGWELDCVVPVPDGSRPAAIQISAELGLPYREGLVKNRYVGRTFIMPDQRTRERSVRRKLNAMPAVFAGKSVLLVDDSIVRGTTMGQIVDMVRAAGAKKVYLASASPPVRYPNVYGVDMPSRKEFVAGDLTEDEVCEALRADGLLYQTVEDLVAVGRSLNPAIETFDAACFTGVYVGGDVSPEYLAALEISSRKRRGAPRAASQGAMSLAAGAV